MFHIVIVDSAGWSDDEQVFICVHTAILCLMFRVARHKRDMSVVS
jgi:hypothetical protein